MRGKSRETSSKPLRDTYGIRGSKPLTRSDPVITRLSFWEHWVTVGHMYRNYRDVDPVFERLMGGKNFKFLLRLVKGPFYYWLFNQGFGLRLGKKLAGQLYLQYRKFLTHVNDIEINEGFRGRGYSYKLLEFAEGEARKRNHRFLTLGVTLTNTRAVNLYRKVGYMEQHHRYFYLSRPTWSEPPDSTPWPAGRKKILLHPLVHNDARQNLRRFFEAEQRDSNPETAPVWETYYRPVPPKSGNGVSFSIHFDDSPHSEGHADFFDWGDRGRWRIYLDPERQGTEDEHALLEFLLYQARGYSNQWVSLGSESHHAKALPLARSLGLLERNGERMLMIKILEPS